MSRLGLFLTFTVLAAPACGSARPGLLDPNGGSVSDHGGDGAGNSGDIGVGGGQDSGPPAADAPGLCGNDILTAQHAPNLYFVLDRSGSMSDLMEREGVSESKLNASRRAIETVLQAVGHRVQYGAAVFPSDSLDGCAAGREVFPTQRGDTTAATGGQSGATLTRLMGSLLAYGAGGGTPAAATLRKLSEPISRLEGTSYVLLFTDGGPNCNANAVCSTDACIPDIERQVLQGGRVCGIDLLCCEDDDFADPGAGCIDETAVAAITNLATSGVNTYVIGLPGASTYADVLSDMAAAGRTERPADAAEAYYAVDSTPALVATLSDITLDLALGCQIELSNPPPDPNDVNVYLDNNLIKSDPENGWTYADESTIELHGEACEALESGAVRKVQIVAGCPTDVL